MVDFRWVVAIHEAGHAVVAATSGCLIERIVINPAAIGDEDGGRCDILPFAPGPLEQAAYSWGGPAAEMHHDPDKAFHPYPDAWQRDVDLFNERIRGDKALECAARELAARIVTERWSTVVAVAEALMVRSVLTAREFYQIVDCDLDPEDTEGTGGSRD
jgi:hypothetical protein